MRTDKNKWKHPVVTAIMNQFEYKKSIIEIIEVECARILQEYLGNNGTVSYPTPIERLAHKCGITEIKEFSNKQLPAYISQNNNTYFVAVDKQHYFGQRFLIAHELSHLLLRRLAGPLSIKEISKAEGFNYEEELLCDIFASCLLVPRSVITSMLDNQKELTANLIDKVAIKLQVSRKVLLNRIALINNKVLLYWDKISNPLNPESDIQLRVNDVFPNRIQVAEFFIPKYCSASSQRFRPNLVKKSFEQGESNFGKSKISNLGSLEAGEYVIQNIFFRYWDPGLGLKEPSSFREHFYSLVTIINTKSFRSSVVSTSMNMQTEFPFLR